MPKNKTPLVIFILLIVLGFWDLYCEFFTSSNLTVSSVMVQVGMKSPFVVFVFGMCVGHFFFRSGIDT